MEKSVGIICFTDGGYRPVAKMGAAGWVMVIVRNSDSNSACELMNVDYYSDSINNEFTNVSLR